MQRAIYFKELAHMIMKPSKSKTCRVRSNQRPRGEVRLWFKSEGCQVRNAFSLRGGPSLALLRPLIDWMRPTYIKEDILLNTNSTDLNVNLLQKHPRRNIQNHI